jgi:hypothetical protein
VTHQLRRLVLAGVLAAAVSACGSDDGADSAPTTTDPSEAPAAGSLPPQDAADLESIYGDALAELGLRLTPRGGLIDRSGGGYVSSASGRHLALYVEPVDADHTSQQYVDGIRSVAVVFADVFERWPELETYDVCQEPPDPDGSQGDEPLPVTQIELTRAQNEAIDWDDVTVVDLVRGSMATPRELTLRVSAELATDPVYSAIAKLVAGDGGATTSDAYQS